LLNLPKNNTITIHSLSEFHTLDFLLGEEFWDLALIIYDNLVDTM